MNRRGSLEWNLETIGKLIIGVAVLVLVFVIIFKVVGLILFGYGDRVSAQQDFRMLTNRIDLAQRGEIGDAESSVIISVAPNHMIVGFPKQGKYRDGIPVYGTFPLYYNKNVVLARPKSCGDAACLCLLDGSVGTPYNKDGVTYATTKAADCKRYDLDVVSTIGEFTFVYRDAVDFSYVVPMSDMQRSGVTTYNVVLAGKPMNVHITIGKDHILLDPRIPGTTGSTVPEPPSSLP